MVIFPIFYDHYLKFVNEITYKNITRLARSFQLVSVVRSVVICYAKSNGIYLLIFRIINEELYTNKVKYVKQKEKQIKILGMNC